MHFTEAQPGKRKIDGILIRKRGQKSCEQRKKKDLLIFFEYLYFLGRKIDKCSRGWTRHVHHRGGWSTNHPPRAYKETARRRHGPCRSAGGGGQDQRPGKAFRWTPPRGDRSPQRVRPRNSETVQWGERRDAELDKLRRVGAGGHWKPWGTPSSTKLTRTWKKFSFRSRLGENS